MQGLNKKAIVRRAGSRIRTCAVASVCAFFMLLLLFAPGAALSGARGGLALCGETVIPSLFPFLVASAFIIKSGIAEKFGRLCGGITHAVFRLPGIAGTVLILGMIGGYPIGAKASADACADGLLKKEEAQRLLCFCINSSPAFIIGAVGAGMLGNGFAGILLYAAHISASVAVGLLMRRKPSATAREARTGSPHMAKNFAGAFVYSVTESAQSTVVIAAFVVLFSAVNSLLSYIGIIPHLSGALASVLPSPPGDHLFYSRALSGIMEVTYGCAAAAGSSGLAAVLLISAALSWSGLSVHFQVAAMVKKSDLSIKSFVLTRFLHMFFSVAAALLLFSLFPSARPTTARGAFAGAAAGAVPAFHSAPATSALLIFCAILILSLAEIRE